MPTNPIPRAEVNEQFIDYAHGSTHFFYECGCSQRQHLEVTDSFLEMQEHSRRPVTCPECAWVIVDVPPPLAEPSKSPLDEVWDLLCAIRSCQDSKVN